MSPAQIMLFYLTRKVAMQKKAAALRDIIWPVATGVAGGTIPIAIDKIRGQPVDPLQAATFSAIGALATTKGQRHAMRGGHLHTGHSELQDALKAGKGQPDLSKSNIWSPDPKNPGSFTMRIDHPTTKGGQLEISSANPQRALAILDPLKSRAGTDAIMKNIGVKAGIGLGLEAARSAKSISSAANAFEGAAGASKKLIEESNKPVVEGLTSTANTAKNVEQLTKDVAATGDRTSRGVENMGEAVKTLTSPLVLGTAGVATAGLLYLLYKMSNRPVESTKKRRSSDDPYSGDVRPTKLRRKYAPADHTHPELQSA